MVYMDGKKKATANMVKFSFGSQKLNGTWQEHLLSHVRNAACTVWLSPEKPRWSFNAKCSVTSHGVLVQPLGNPLSSMLQVMNANLPSFVQILIHLRNAEKRLVGVGTLSSLVCLTTCTRVSELICAFPEVKFQQKVASSPSHPDLLLHFTFEINLIF